MGHLEVKKLDETFCSENHDTNIASDTKRNEVNFDDTRKILELFNMCVCNYIYSYFLHRNLHNFNFLITQFCYFSQSLLTLNLHLLVKFKMSLVEAPV